MLELTKMTRSMEVIIIRMVSEKMVPNVSFLRRLICTFQSRLMGKATTASGISTDIVSYSVGTKMIEGLTRGIRENIHCGLYLQPYP